MRQVSGDYDMPSTTSSSYYCLLVLGLLSPRILLLPSTTSSSYYCLLVLGLLSPRILLLLSTTPSSHYCLSYY